MRPLAHSSVYLLTATLALSIGYAIPSLSCYVMPDKTQDLSLEVAPGVKREIYTAYYKRGEGGGDCSASINVSLSSFPTSSLATRPRDIAVVIREVMDLWELDNCTIRVWYDNDTGEEFAEHELCLTENFQFDQGAYWSASAERYCWEPSQFEFEPEEFESEEIVEDELFDEPDTDFESELVIEQIA